MSEQIPWKEFGQAMKEQSQDRRANNRESSAAILTNKEIPFESKNGGAHLIVNGGEVDFWPGTGKWIFRKSRKQGRGVLQLLKALQSIDKQQMC